MATNNNINTNLMDIWRDGMLTSSRQVMRLQRSFDQLFEQFFSPLPRMLMGMSEGTQAYVPPCDIEETESHYLVRFDLPGVSKQDLRVVLNKNQLTVSGERRKEVTRREGGQVTEETFQGYFERNIALPGVLRSENVDAIYQDGILRIRVAKVHTESQVRKIPIHEVEEAEQQARMPSKVRQLPRRTHHGRAQKKAA